MKKLRFAKTEMGIWRDDLTSYDDWTISEDEFFGVNEEYKTESLSSYDLMRIEELARLEKHTHRKEEIEKVNYYYIEIQEINEDGEVIDTEELKSFYELEIPVAEIRN